MPRRVGLSLRPVVVAVVVGAACHVASAVPGGSKKHPNDVQQFGITATHAYLYYHERGQFDGTDITSGTVALRNIVTGEGEALKPSGAILVLAELRGPDFAKAVPRSAALTMVAKSSGHQIALVTARLKDFFSQESSIKIPFLVYGTACDEVEITARLEGAGTESAASVSLPFSCGG